MTSKVIADQLMLICILKNEEKCSPFSYRSSNFAIAKLSLLLALRNSWKIDNYMGSNTEKKP